jgi:hypothetical protein
MMVLPVLLLLVSVASAAPTDRLAGSKPNILVLFAGTTSAPSTRSLATAPPSNYSSPAPPSNDLVACSPSLTAAAQMTWVWATSASPATRRHTRRTSTR